jgi:hypothetical protein
MKKIVKLTESDLMRIVQRVINEQEGDTDKTRLEGLIQDYVKNKKEISADWIFSKTPNDVQGPSKDPTIGSRYIAKNPDFNRIKWDDSIEKYRKNKDQTAFKQLMDFVRNGTVIIKPFNGGNITPFKFVVSGNTGFKIVECPECVNYNNN